MGKGQGPSPKGSTCPIRIFSRPFWSSGTLQCPPKVLIPLSSSLCPFRVVSPSPLSLSESSNGPQIGVLVPLSFPYSFTLAIVLVRVLKWSSDRCPRPLALALANTLKILLLGQHFAYGTRLSYLAAPLMVTPLLLRHA